MSPSFWDEILEKETQVDFFRVELIATAFIKEIAARLLKVCRLIAQCQRRACCVGDILKISYLKLNDLRQRI